MTEDEMIGWHHLLDGHEFEQTLADSEGQGSLVQSMRSQRVRYGLAQNKCETRVNLGFAVPRRLVTTEGMPKRGGCSGFTPTYQCQEGPNVSMRGATRNG